MNFFKKEKVEKKERDFMFLYSQSNGVEPVLKNLKKIGVPEDCKWQTLILYLRYIAEYNYLTLTQKKKIRKLLIDIVNKKKFDEEEYNKVNKALGDILFEPYKKKLKEVVKESHKLVKSFAETSQLRKKHIEDLEQHTIEVIEKTDDIEIAIKKIKQSFKQVLDLVEQDIKNLYEDVNIDSLTSLYNRKFLDINLDKILDKCKENSVPCCILMFDIDDFKKINDTYGHRIGDQALKIVAKIIKEKGEKYLLEKRKGNFFPTRYGGEEFCLILEGYESKEGYNFGENIRKGIAKYNFIVRSVDGEIVESGIKITVSGGVSSTYKGDKFGETLIEEADQALYRAKRSGKNRIEVYNLDG
ncbi:GGDEF domain-containing protein [Desulfothermus naphthae]